MQLAAVARTVLPASGFAADAAGVAVPQAGEVRSGAARPPVYQQDVVLKAWKSEGSGVGGCAMRRLPSSDKPGRLLRLRHCLAILSVHACFCVHAVCLLRTRDASAGSPLCPSLGGQHTRRQSMCVRLYGSATHLQRTCLLCKSGARARAGGLRGVDAGGADDVGRRRLVAGARRDVRGHALPRRRAQVQHGLLGVHLPARRVHHGARLAASWLQASPYPCRGVPGGRATPATTTYP